MVRLKFQVNRLNQLHHNHEKRIVSLERSEELLRIISDKEAEKEIIQLLKGYKLSGKNQINILSIASKLNLPVEQVDRILDQLEEEDLVSDVE